MSELLPFCKIKLQYLLEMVTDHELDDNALRVALYLALAHADHETGESRPSFETIGTAIGKHAKSVKRALNKVEAAGYMTVERGTNKGKSSRYRPTEAAMRRATERCWEGDKVVPLSRAKGGQSCPQRGTELSGKGGQDRPSNREQELRKEQGRASAPDLPVEGQSGETRPDLVFVPRGICFVREWDARLIVTGIASMMGASWFWASMLTRSELTGLGLTRIDQGEQTWLTLDPDRTELKTCTLAGTPVICIKIEEK